MSGAPKHKLHPASTAPWTIRLTKELSDGEWHDYKQIVTLVAPVVPPGQAYRYSETRRLAEYKKRGTEPRDRVFGDKNSTIRSGQKYYVRESVRSLKARGVLEVEYDSNPKLKYRKPIRLRMTAYGMGLLEKEKIAAQLHEAKAKVVEAEAEAARVLAEQKALEKKHPSPHKHKGNPRPVPRGSKPIPVAELLQQVWDNLNPEDDVLNSIPKDGDTSS